MEKLKFKKKYKKIKNWRSIVQGPWIHQNIIEAIRNIKLNKKFTGGKKVNESDGYCAALPYFLYGHSFKDIENIIKTVTVSKISIKYALSKFYILDFALKGVKNPVKNLLKNLKEILILKMW